MSLHPLRFAGCGTVGKHWHDAGTDHPAHGRRVDKSKRCCREICETDIGGEDCFCQLLQTLFPKIGSLNS